MEQYFFFKPKFTLLQMIHTKDSYVTIVFVGLFNAQRAIWKMGKRDSYCIVSFDEAGLSCLMRYYKLNHDEYVEGSVLQ